MAYGTFFLMWTLCLQTGLGWSAMRAGLTGLPMFLGLLVSAGTTVQFLTPRFGRKVLFAGGLLLIAGALGLVWAHERYGVDISSLEMSVPLFVFGLGMGAVLAPVLDFALTGVPHKVAGSASGVLNTSGQLGSAVGIALVAVLFLVGLPGQSGKGVDAVEPRIRQDLAAVGVTDERVSANILAAFRVCVDDRMAEVGPDVVPGSCRERPQGVPDTQLTAVEQVLAKHTPEVRAETFARAFRTGLFYVMGLFALMTALMFALPRFARPEKDTALIG